jgi:hypothetical protein
VDVDEAGSHDVTVGPEDTRTAEPFADLDDATVGHGDVGPEAGRASAVDQRSAADDQVCAHACPLSVLRTGRVAPATLWLVAVASDGSWPRSQSAGIPGSRRSLMGGFLPVVSPDHARVTRTTCPC